MSAGSPRPTAPAASTPRSTVGRSPRATRRGASAGSEPVGATVRRVEPAQSAQPAQPTQPAWAAGQLDDRDQALLDFERHWFTYAGAKEQAVRDLFGVSATRYYQLINALIDRPEALAADPMLVKRLRRLRSSRQRVRSARRLGVELGS